MKIFDFDQDAARATYRTAGWVHVREAVTAEFLDYALDFVSSPVRHALAGVGNRVNKDQFLFVFDDPVGAQEELLAALSYVSDLDPRQLTLSERHVNAYNESCVPEPSPHKDRLASQVSAGISLVVPASACLVLYPDADRTTNPFTTSDLRLRLPPGRRPEVVLERAREVVIADRPGDLVVFPGSTMWHLRRRGAGTTNLFFKVNAFGSDPLGEDVATPALRAETERTLLLPDARMQASRPVRSRRFECVAREYRRDDWSELLVARAWEGTAVLISDVEADLLRTVDGACDVSELARRLGREPSEVNAAVRRLAEHELLDLLSGP